LTAEGLAIAHAAKTAPVPPGVAGAPA
jgi:hypothetical protein